MRTRLLRFRGRSTLATLVMAAGLCVSGCGYQAVVGNNYLPGYYSAISIHTNKSHWGRVERMDRCLSGWSLQLHLRVGERKEPNERVSMVVLGNATGRMPWAEGDVFLVLEGGVEDAAVVVPCESQKDGTVIGLYSDSNKSKGRTDAQVRSAFVDQHRQVLPGADEYGRPSFPYCYPICPPESPLVTLPSLAPCVEAPTSNNAPSR